MARGRLRRQGGRGRSRRGRKGKLVRGRKRGSRR